MQIMADVTHRNIETVCDPQEAGAGGAALVAAGGLAIYPEFESLKEVVKVDRVFEPQPENSEIYDTLFNSYQRVYTDLRDFYRKLNKERFDKTTCEGGV